MDLMEKFGQFLDMYLGMFLPIMIDLVIAGMIILVLMVTYYNY